MAQQQQPQEQHDDAGQRQVEQEEGLTPATMPWALQAAADDIELFSDDESQSDVDDSDDVRQARSGALLPLGAQLRTTRRQMNRGGTEPSSATPLMSVSAFDLATAFTPVYHVRLPAAVAAGNGDTNGSNSGSKRLLAAALSPQHRRGLQQSTHQSSLDRSAGDMLCMSRGSEMAPRHPNRPLAATPTPDEIASAFTPAVHVTPIGTPVRDLSPATRARIRVVKRRAQALLRLSKNSV